MRNGAWLGVLVVGGLLSACASAPPPVATAPATEEPREPKQEAAAAEPPIAVAMPERTAAPSTATYEQATAVPEALDVNDERHHLTDGQLTGPMRGVLQTCRVPGNAHVTIKTAVQNGRAIGVSVAVAFEHPKAMKRVPTYVVKAEQKTASKIVSCADKNTRAIVWPPSNRRDSFTTTF